MSLDITVQNIIAIVSFKRELPLYVLERNLSNSLYAPRQFPGLIYRMEEPEVTAVIFRSGKSILAGAKNVDEIIRATKKLIKVFRKLGIEITERPIIQIQNIVATSHLGRSVNLEKAALVLENVIYEPEQFPGLLYRLEKPKVTLIIFGNGKAVIAGAKRIEDIRTALKLAFDALAEKECFIEELES